MARVDPDEPSQAVAFSQPRWDLFSIFALLSTLFAVFGGPIFLGAVAPSILDGRTKLLAAASVVVVAVAAVVVAWP